MNVVRSHPDRSGPCVVTIGIYDGLHEGHRELLNIVRQEATKRNIATALLTFDPHPRSSADAPRGQVHRPLMTLEDRLALIADTDLVDTVFVLPFTDEFRRMSPHDFAKDVIKGRLLARMVVVGENFRFGYRRAGDVRTLDRLGDRLGFEVAAVPLVLASLEGQPISSSAIRELVQRGEVKAASRLIGRHYELRGQLMRHAELRTGSGLCLPAAGHYMGVLENRRTGWQTSVVVHVDAIRRDHDHAIRIRTLRESLERLSPDEAVSLRFIERVQSTMDAQLEDEMADCASTIRMGTGTGTE
jgi:riboflavin kinase/FMN adenylyltransferase